MYIALTQPEIPELRASIKLTPVEKPLMRVRTHYKKESIWSKGVCLTILLLWLAFVLADVITHYA